MCPQLATIQLVKFVGVTIPSAVFARMGTYGRAVAAWYARLVALNVQTIYVKVVILVLLCKTTSVLTVCPIVRSAQILGVAEHAMKVTLSLRRILD